MTKEKKFKQKRKFWFRAMKRIMRIKYKRPEFIFLGEKPTNGSIILSNHEGTDAPMSIEIYCDFPIRMWGTNEMNSGLVNLYKYQTKVYYHEKKHWNLFLARLFCLIASPLTNLFYKGLSLISTYKDIRLRTTIKESFESIKKGENIVIFPEKSDEGYLKQLKGFHAGFILLAKECEKNGIDVPIYTAYYKKDNRKYIFDKPIYFSELKAQYSSKDSMCEYLVNNCNNLASVNKKSDKIETFIV